MRTLVIRILCGCLIATLSAACGTARAEEYTVDATHSSVVFRIKHMEVSYCYGRFNKLSGKFALDDNDPTQGVIDVTVEADSVDTGNEKRDEHLRNADFFDAKTFPKIHFASKSISRNKDGSYQAAGELTLHGETRPVTIDIEPTGEGKGQFGETRRGLEAIFTIRRSEFGMDRMVGPVADDVRLMVSLEGIKQ